MIEVVAVLIRQGDKFLICQRPAYRARELLWKFIEKGVDFYVKKK